MQNRDTTLVFKISLVSSSWFFQGQSLNTEAFQPKENIDWLHPYESHNLVEAHFQQDIKVSYDLLGV